MATSKEAGVKNKIGSAGRSGAAGFPMRAGKGVGIVIPNLLDFNDSVVVLDVKQEHFVLTAGFRDGR